MIFHYYKDKDGKLIDDIVLPRSIDNRQICPPILDQKEKPWCASFSLTQIIELTIWREYGILVAIDEEALYKEAKRIDGMDCDGTSLEAAIQAALNLGNFEGSVSVEHIPNSRENIMRAVHKYDILFAGFNITDHWFSAKDQIPTGGQPVGGHAAAIVGYDDDGVMICNSWGTKNWGSNGFSILKWADLKKQYMGIYGIKVA